MQMKSYSVTQDIQQTRAKHCDKEGAAYRPYSWTPPLKKPQAPAALSWDFLGGPGLRNWLAVQAMLVLSLVRELRYLPCVVEQQSLHATARVCAR